MKKIIQEKEKIEKRWIELIRLSKLVDDKLKYQKKIHCIILQSQNIIKNMRKDLSDLKNLIRQNKVNTNGN